MKDKTSNLVQIAAIVAGWVVFAWMWKRVLTVTSTATIGRTVTLLAIAACVIALVNSAWVAHNRRIYRAKGPRRSVPSVEPRFEQDFLGRAMLRDTPEVDRMPRVDVIVVGNTKLFVTSRGSGTAPLGGN